MKLQAFFTAIQEANYALVSQGLREGMHANLTNESGETALDIALMNGHDEIASLLTNPMETVAILPEAFYSSHLSNQDPDDVHAIAIVGMACRFAGQAKDLDGFWNSLVAGQSQVKSVPHSRFPFQQARQDSESYFSSILSGDISQFAADFFRISPREAHLMDPQQRLLLEETYHALENGGFSPSDLNGARVGVYVGQMTHDYMDLITRDCHEGDPNLATGNIGSVLSGRLSYIFNFIGESLTVNTACSSSLVAAHLAANSLRRKEVDMAIVGGVNLILDPRLQETAARAGMTARDGQCKTFSSLANGYGRGEGVGVLLFKRLVDAQHGGDRILAVLKGSAVNQDGASSQLTAPNQQQQIEVIKQALTDAHLDSQQIDLLEAHGTGTALGDPIEMGALQSVYAYDGSNRSQALQVRSVKANIGHTEAAAGMASLIKVILSMTKSQIPGQINCLPLNPKMDLAQGRLMISEETIAWKRSDERLRRAGVSSFGFSGTNAHVIIEEAPKSISTFAEQKSSELQLLVLSAKTISALCELVKNYKAYLNDQEKLGNVISLTDVAYTAAIGRAHYRYRASWSVASVAEWSIKLGEFNPEDQQATGLISFQFSNLTDQQIINCQNWLLQDPNYHAHTRCYAEAWQKVTGLRDFSIINDHPNTLTEVERYAVGMVFQLAAANNYQSCGLLNLQNLFGIGIGSLIVKILQETLTIEAGLEACLSPLKVGATHAELGVNDRCVIPADGYNHFIDNVAWAYQRGYTINWQSFWYNRAANKVELPGYPFERQSYWYTKVLKTTSLAHQVKLNRIPARLSEMVWQHDIDLSSVGHSYLLDHQVLGKCYYPAAAFINLLIDTLQSWQPNQSLQIEALQLQRPLILQHGERRTCQIVCRHSLNGLASTYYLEIASYATERSGDAHLVHMTAQVKWLDEKPEREVVARLKTSENMSFCQAGALYERLQNHGLKYGAPWRAVKKIEHNEVNARIELVSDRSITDVNAIKVSNLDAVLHGCMALIAHEELENDDTLLPKSFEEIKINGEMAAVSAAYVEREKTEESFAIFNIKLLSESNAVVAEIKHYAVAKMPINNRVFPENVYQVQWQQEQKYYKLLWNDPLAFVELKDMPSWQISHAGNTVLPNKNQHLLKQYGMVLIQQLLINYWPSLLKQGSAFNIAQPEKGHFTASHAYKFFYQCFCYLAEEELIQLTGDDVIVKQALPESSLLQEQARSMQDASDPQNVFLTAVYPQIEDVFSKKREPVAVLFPVGTTAQSPNHAGYIYQYARDAYLANSLVAAVISKLSSYVHSKSLRILEIGAGTGGTTRAILPALKQFDRVDYCYTDISPAFRANCLEIFAGFENITHQYEVLNIGSDLQRQAFFGKQFDLVIATNVLHATVDIEVTVKNVRRLTKLGGVAIISETTEKSPWIDLTFGLLSGWWLARDAYRQQHPLLSKEKWVDLLQGNGFACQHMLGEGQTVFVSEAIVHSLRPDGAVDPQPDVVICAYETKLIDNLAKTLLEMGYFTKAIDLSHKRALDAWQNDVAILSGQDSGPMVIYIPPQVFSDFNIKDYQALLCQPLLNLLKILNGNAVNLLVCLHGACAVTANNQIVSPEQIIARGLIKSAAKENPQWHCKIIHSDLSRVDSARVQKLLNCFALPNTENEIALYENTIWVPRLMPSRENESVVANNAYSSDDVILITGGTGEIGQALMRDLMSRGARKFALIARHASARAITTLNQSLEGTVNFYQDDLSDLAKLKKTFQQISARYGSITHIYHLAGTLSDKLLRNMEWQDLLSVFTAKIIGTYHLHVLSQDYPIKQFVLFSSVASLFATPGQMNHVAANDYLNSLAQYRKQQGFPALSIAWGFWSGIGSAAKHQAIAAGAKKGFLSMSPQEALELLQQINYAERATVVLAQFDWDKYQQHEKNIDKIFSQAFTRGVSREISHEASALKFDFSAISKQSLNSKQKQAVIAEHILMQLADVLMIESRKSLSVQQRFNEFPVEIDSYANSQFIERVNQFFKLTGSIAELSSNAVYKYENVDAIASAVLEHLDERQSDVSASTSGLKAQSLDEDVQQVITAQRNPYENTDSAAEPIAIIGMSLRLPGANSPEEFWNLLHSHADPKTGNPPYRHGKQCYYSADEKSATAPMLNAAFLATDIAKFDSGFFNISCDEATVMAPEQRLLLELSHEALEHAGIPPSHLHGSDASVVIGIASSEFGDLLLHHSDPSELSRHHATGNNPSSTVGRISYHFGLRGFNCAVNTACSSSLVSINLACQQLWSHNSALAITGGVNIILSPKQMALYQRNGMLSSGNGCHTFSANADGIARSEGAVVFILKRISDARQDGNRVLAVIESTTTNQDGASVSLMSPDLNAQKALHRASLKKSGITREQVDWIEAHGTGTKFGDPIEVEAIANELGRVDRKIPIGAVKSNLGAHPEAASGAVGLVKVVLSLLNQEIPANRGIEKLNPILKPFMQSVELIQENRPWRPSDGRTRRALISSFGFSGTNAQAVIAEADGPTVSFTMQLNKVWQALRQAEIWWRDINYVQPIERASAKELIVISAKQSSALQACVANFKDWLMANKGKSNNRTLKSIAYSLSHGRDHYPYRLTFQVKDIDELCEVLASDLEWVAEIVPSKKPKKIAFLFTGQGSQYTNMSRELYENNVYYRSVIDYCAAELGKYLSEDIKQIMFNEKLEQQLQSTEYAQPALFIVEYALALLWVAYGLKPDYVMGHSVGEYVAATLAGCLSLSDALRLIVARGKAMAKAPAGRMLAVAADKDTVERILQDQKIDLDVAGVNSPKQVILSGTTDNVQRATEYLKANGMRCSLLKTNKAFHSRLMDAVLEDFRQVAQRITYQAGQHAVLITTLTGKPVMQMLTADHWVAHLRQGVDFFAGMQTLDSDNVEIFCELGPNSVLLPLAKQCLGVKASTKEWLEALKKTSPNSVTIQQGLATWYQLGGDVNWSRVWLGQQAELLNLPHYPFQRSHYWPPTLGGKANCKMEPDQSNRELPAKAVNTQPLDPRERLVMKCLLDCLGRAVNKTDVSFSELGGDSIHLPDFQSLLFQTTGVSFSLQELNSLTISAIVNRLPNEIASNSGVAIKPADWHKPFPLNQIQYAYWIGRQGLLPLGNVSAHGYLEVIAIDLSVERLQHALNKLIDRHAMLRMIIGEDGLQRVQEQVPAYRIPIADLRLQPVCERERQLDALRESLSHQVKDPSQWPLFEVHITQISDSKSILHLSFDSLIVDMYSMRLLFDEWYQLYCHEDLELEPLTITFRDYYYAIEANKQSKRYAEDKAYWMQRIPNMPLGPELPLQQEPAQIKQQRFARCNHIVSPETIEKLQAKSKSHQLNLTSILLTVFAVVLGRYSRQQQFLINLTLFRREHIHPQVKNILGDFTDIAVLGCDVRDAHQIQFSDLVNRHHQQLWQDLEHAQFSGVAVQRELAQHHQLGAGQAVAPVVFTSLLNLNLNREGEQQFTAGKKGSVWQQFGEVQYSITQTPQIWLDFKTFISDEGLAIEWDYVESLFDNRIIGEMHGLFCQFIESLISFDWHKPLPDILSQRLIALDKSQNRALCNTSYEKNASLLSLVSMQFVFSPQAIAVIDQHRELTYQQLQLASMQLAAALQQQGVRKNDVVAVALDRGCDLIVAIVAIAFAGAVYLPIDVEMPDKRKALIIEDSSPKVILSISTYADLWKSRYNVLAIDENGFSPKLAYHPVISQPMDLAYLLYTSGSSGKPKGVLIENQAIINRLLWMRDEYEINHQDVILHKTPIAFDVSLWELWLPLISGATVAMANPGAHKDASALKKAIIEFKITHLHFVPPMLSAFLSVSKQDEFPLLKTITCSGEALAPSQVHLFNEKFTRARLYNLYGPTEAAIDVTYWIAPRNSELNRVPIGKPISNVGFVIVNAQNQLCPPGVPGELCLSGIQLAREYLNLPEKTAGSFIKNIFYDDPRHDRFYRTGDLVELGSDGDIYYLGRMDSQVKIRGQRIELEEIQSVLEQQSLVEQAAVLCFQDDRKNSSLVAFIKPAVVPSLQIQQAKLHGVISSPQERDQFKTQLSAIFNLPTSDVVMQLDKPDQQQAAKMFQRKSYRQFQGDNLAISDIVACLQSSAYPVVPDSKPRHALAEILLRLAAYSDEKTIFAKHPYPSAGSLYPVKCYIAVGDNEFGIARGFYYFESITARLIQIALPAEQVDISTYPGFSIALVAHGRLIQPLYGQYWRDFAAIEAGCMQYLLAESGGKCYLNPSLGPTPAWIKALPTLEKEDLILGAWRYDDSSSENDFRDVEKPSLTVWVYFPKALGEIEAGLYHYNAQQLQKCAEAAYPLFLNSQGDNAGVVAAARAMVFMTTSEITIPSQMAVGQKIMMLMQAGIGKYIGFCPLGVCPLPRAYEQIIKEPVVMTLALGPITHEQLMAHNTSTAENHKLSLSEYYRDCLTQTSLTEAMYPDYFITVPEIPVTLNGKIDRSRLKAIYAAHSQLSQVQFIPPANRLEQEIHDLWCELLPGKFYDGDQSFFSVGGNSLLVNQLAGKLSQRFAVTISLGELFQNNSIKKMAMVINFKQDASWALQTFPLAKLVAQGNVDLIKRLIASGKLNLNQQDSAGRTALYIATQLGKSEMVTFLLQCSADMTIRKHSGISVLDCARYHHPDLVVLLKQHQGSQGSLAKGVTAQVKQWGVFAISSPRRENSNQPAASAKEFVI